MNQELIDARLSTLHEDVTDIKAAVRELTGAVTRLALVEERLSMTGAAQERAFNAISNVEKRVVEIEKRLPEYTKSSIWIDRGVWAAVAALAVYAAKKIGLL